ncbi:PQQ-dependent sugar dehydrogenase [Pseudogemmobacter humi]|uniref:Soluble aldose sugar dehydrogenase YliI n=1 Tax=Pseudogemmobacter humi TaxID=2483812 RepID=A0A3P5X730_9RHOB|nr:PQQ-dependent sugar dehydrogenase [Pseudogemmobacter humi]VDC30182.1 Soluble aldose sugar dehydrogenase YliI precursor [Pseudogemmobacter humi]
MSRLVPAVFAAVMLSLPGVARADTVVATSAGEMEIRRIADGLDTPWALAFLPDGSLLITERGGRLLRLNEGAAQEIAGLPEVAALGQGGLLDVMVAADFAQSREIWLTWAGRSGEGLASMAGRGRLSEDFLALEGFETLFTGESLPASRHFGARLVGAADGSVFVTLGDRGTGPGGQEAQDPALSVGSVVHLNPDGSPATVREGWRAGVWSIGHRNIQGAALMMPDGGLLIVEHGAKGGDEINLAAEGLNYGWPVISYGVNYNGRRIGTGTHAEGMEQPLHYWDPSIAPSGLMVYSGALVPGWRGDVFTGSLKSDFISRLDPDAAAATGWAEERIASDETLRVRDIREGPDGAIWFLSEERGALYRMAPVE